MAAELIKQAEKKTKSSWWFWSSPDYEGAAELYQQAAHLLSTESKTEDAINAYLKSAKYYELEKDIYQVAECHKKIYALCKITDDNRTAASSLNIIIDCYRQRGDWSALGKYNLELAELFSTQLNTLAAVRTYDEAARYFNLAGSWASHDSALDRKCRFLISIGDYREAAISYDILCTNITSSENLIRKYRLADYTLLCICCYLANDDPVTARRIFDQKSIVETDHKYRLIANILTTVAERNREQFQSIIRDYQSVTPLSDSLLAVLLKIYSQLVRGESLL
jgi:tetratricopeptide (TPR) repeat protein